MPFALVTIGLLMIVTGARNTHAEFGAELRSDFTGDRNFLYWIVAIGAVGSLGYIPAFKNFSRVFMTLIIVAMIIRNGGFFQQLTTALEMGPEKIEPGANPAVNQQSPETMLQKPGEGFADWLNRTNPQNTWTGAFMQIPALIASPAANEMNAIADRYKSDPSSNFGKVLRFLTLF